MAEKKHPVFPDIPTTETIHGQGTRVPLPPTAGPLATGERHSAIEYIEVIQRLPMGPIGPTGPTGPEGEDGAEWIIGTGDPNDPNSPATSTGPNDVYLDEDTGEIWYWNSVSKKWYPSGTSIMGPIGLTGPQGLLGPTGPTGPTGLQGGGIKVLGTYIAVPTGSEPPLNGNETGDGWIDETGDLWGWIITDSTTTPPTGEWHNYGPVQGPQGPAGPGIQIMEVPFAFVSDNVWATQTITHSISSGLPSVRVLIDFDGTGIFSAAQMVHISYLSNTEILLTADPSITTYNGTFGKVVLQ